MNLLHIQKIKANIIMAKNPLVKWQQLIDEMILINSKIDEVITPQQKNKK